MTSSATLNSGANKALSRRPSLKYDTYRVFKRRYKLIKTRGSQKMVTFFVRGTVFHVHKTHICHHSPFFRAAFEGSFSEATSLRMVLDDVNPKIFGLLVNWAYSENIVDDAGNRPSCTALIDLWILADRFIMADLQNQAMEDLDKARLEGKLCTANVPRRVYENTREDSPLRMYLVDMCVEGVTGGFRDTDPPEFLIDVINGLRLQVDHARRVAGKTPTQWAPSERRMKTYHVKKEVDHLRIAPSQ